MEVDIDVDSLVGDSVCSFGTQLGPVHAFDRAANVHEHSAPFRHESRELTQYHAIVSILIFFLFKERTVVCRPLSRHVDYIDYFQRDCGQSEKEANPIDNHCQKDFHDNWYFRLN